MVVGRVRRGENRGEGRSEAEAGAPDDCACECDAHPSHLSTHGCPLQVNEERDRQGSATAPKASHLVAKEDRRNGGHIAATSRLAQSLTATTHHDHTRHTKAKSIDPSHSFPLCHTMQAHPSTPKRSVLKRFTKAHNHRALTVQTMPIQERESDDGVDRAATHKAV
jgi:hypothetical protein